MIVCSNCGAQFEEKSAKCPYCGALHYTGARKEYMNKLHGMRRDMDDLHQTVPEMYTEELKKQTKHAGRIGLIIVAVIAAIVLILAGIYFVSDFALNAFGIGYDEKEALLFTKEAFPIMDEFYEAGDYDGMLEFYYQSVQENENASFYSWDHYPLLMCLENNKLFEEAAALLGTEEFSEYYMQEIFYCYISNRYYQKGYSMEEKDQLLTAAMEDEMEAVIDSLQLTQEERKAFNDLLNASEYPSWDEVNKFATKIYKRLY